GAGNTGGNALVVMAGWRNKPNTKNPPSGGPPPARKHDHAVPDPDERFEPLLDIRHHHEVVDERIRRLCGDDAGLGQPDVAHGRIALFCVTDRRAFHRPLHRARTTPGADVETAQPEVIADLFRVLVLDARDRMAAPAHDQL